MFCETIAMSTARKGQQNRQAASRAMAMVLVICFMESASKNIVIVFPARNEKAFAVMAQF